VSRFALGALLVAIALSSLALGEPVPARPIPHSGGAAGSASAGGNTGEPTAAPVALPAGSGGSASTTAAGLASSPVQLWSEPPLLHDPNQQEDENDREADPTTPIDLNPALKTTAPTAAEVQPPA